MKLKVSRFRTRAPDLVAVPRVLPVPPPVMQAKPAPAPKAVAKSAVAAAAKPAVKPPPGQIGDDAFFPDENDDGFDGQSFLPPEPPKPAALKPNPVTPIAPPEDGSAPQDLDAIRREGLTGRQLRLARRMAQKHDLPATSDFDAVRLLRQAGIDPFQRSAVLDLVTGEPEDALDAMEARGDLKPSPDPSRALTVPRADQTRLPQTMKPAPVPSTEVRVEQAHIAEVRRIQQDIVARRRRRVGLLWAKLSVFVFLPTLIAGWYYYMVATPMFSAHTEFVIQQSTATSQISSLFTGTTFATSQDSVAVQGYLNSIAAMERLDADNGFRAHFSDPIIDPIQRLAPNATKEQTYGLYQRYVKISYDPTEGVIKMDVATSNPTKSVELSQALIHYAEEQVDHLTKRLRGDQEKSAAASFADAQTKLQASQQNLVTLQEKYKTLSADVEASLVTTQIGGLESQLTQERLALAQMESNLSPNRARMDPVKARIAALQDQIDTLHKQYTDSSAGGPSIAAVQSELVMAAAEVTTRQMMLSQATNAMETSRIEANRQTRYLSVSVEPVAPDSAAFPRAFENTLIVMLIFGGIYLMISMTIAILREQVSG